MLGVARATAPLLVGSVWGTGPDGHVRSAGTGQLQSTADDASPADGPLRCRSRPDEAANRLLATEPLAVDARDAARPAGPDGVGVPGAGPAAGAPRRHARRGRDRGDAGRGPRGDLPGQARAAPVSRLDGEAHARARASSSSSTTTARGRGVWADAETGDELLARVKALPGLRRGEGADLRRPARQAARRAAAAAGRRRPPTGRRSPTSTATTACSRSASRSARMKARQEQPPASKPRTRARQATGFVWVTVRSLAPNAVSR